MSEDDTRLYDLLEANKRLEDENSRLTDQVKSLKESRANWWQMRFWAGKKIGGVFLGWRLSDAIKRLVKELKEKNVKNETIGDVLTHILWRFTRVGMIALMLAVIPSAILIIQTQLLCNQNRLLDIQNERVAQQNQLIEAQRRSSYIFMLGNLMEAINKELDKPNNPYRRLSKELIGQIISLSGSFVPYTFMIGDTLTKEPLSPERGLLLTFLLESAINTEDLNSLISNSTFYRSYSHTLRIHHDTLDVINLAGSTFGQIYFGFSIINRFDCTNCKVRYLFIEDGKYSNLEFANIDTINYVTITNSQLIDVTIDCAWMGFLQIMQTNSNNITLLSDNIGTLLITGSTIKNLVIEGDVIDSIYMSSSLLLGDNKINMFKNEYSLKTDAYSMIHNTWLKRTSVPTKINFVSMLSSFINNIESKSIVDSFYLQGCVFRNRVNSYFDFNNAILYTSIVSNHLIQNSKHNSRPRKYIRSFDGQDEQYVMFSEPTQREYFERLEEDILYNDPNNQIWPDWREEN